MEYFQKFCFQKKVEDINQFYVIKKSMLLQTLFEPPNEIEYIKIGIFMRTITSSTKPFF